MYGVVLGAWASNNKYSLLGGLRSSAQMISYELTLGLAIIGILMLTSSLSLRAIAVEQGILSMAMELPDSLPCIFSLYSSHVCRNKSVTL